MIERRTSWLVDSGERYDICNDRAVFTFLAKMGRPVDINIGDTSTLSGEYDGTVDGLFMTASGTYCLTLPHVLYIPTASFSSISVSQTAVSGYATRFEGVNCAIYKYGTYNVVLKVKHTGRAYQTMVTTKKVQLPEVQVSSGEANHNMLWHRRLDH